jgi:hypothetical protein
MEIGRCQGGWSDSLCVTPDTYEPGMPSSSVEKSRPPEAYDGPLSSAHAESATADTIGGSVGGLSRSTFSCTPTMTTNEDIQR